MTLTWAIDAEQARKALRLYRDVLDGRGCMCVQSGREPCATVRKAARLDRIAVVEGHPELTAELRAAAERVLARER